MKRKILSLALAVLMCCSCIPSVFAAEKTIPVKLTADLPAFSVTMPTSIPINVSATGVVTCPTNLAITNNSAGPVEVTKIEVEEGGWKITSYNDGDDSLIDALGINSKRYGFELTANGEPAATSIDGSQELDFDSAKWVVAGNGCSMNVGCAAVAGVVTTGETNTAVGTATFTVKLTEKPAAEAATPVSWDPYLTFSSPSSFSLKTNNGAKNWDGTLEYSTDTSTWTAWDGITELSSSGNVLYLRGTDNTVITGNSLSNGWILTGSNIACSGNIETLLDYTEVESGEHPTMTSKCYRSMFMSCTSLTTAPALPATTLADGCYQSMFNGCTSLTTAPVLPATTLTASCYTSMFKNCTNLTTVPALPATTLNTSCYYSMFEGCTSLTTAPALPATTLADSCYYSMFNGCTNLTSAPVLPATTLATSCYNCMFYGCASLKLSKTQTGEYTQAYRVPTSGDGTTADNALTNMFTGIGGTFSGTPTLNTTYYLHSTNSIVS